jgi:hypothetical protein
MVDEAEDAGSGHASRDVKAELDERRIARTVAIGLPILTVTFALAAGAWLGPAIATLVLAAGMLLGVIALFWASIRVLSGDAALSPELEALDATAHAVDALSSRKRMLVRALKDLDNERALGKLEEEDHEQLSTTYRGELKEVMKRIDASLEPHRSKAEDAARAHLEKAGLAGTGAATRGAPPPTVSAPVVDDEDDEDDDEVESEPSPKAATAKPSATRVTCSACATSNEIDASFCKKCGASLAKDAIEQVAKAAAQEAADEA